MLICAARPNDDRIARAARDADGVVTAGAVDSHRVGLVVARRPAQHAGQVEVDGR